MHKIRTFFLKIHAGIFQTLSANVINKTVQLLCTTIITRILTTEEYGLWSYVLNKYSYLMLITGLGLISGAMQFGAENKGQGKAFSFYKYCISRGLFVDLVLITGYGVVVTFVELPIKGAKPFILLILPCLIFEYISSIGQSVLRGQNRIKDYAKVLNYNTVSVAIGTCVGSFFGIKGMVCGKYSADVFSILITLHFLSRETSQIINAERIANAEKRSLWQYSLFTGASSAMNGLVYYLDISIIARLIHDTTCISVYKVGTIIPNALQFIPSSIVIAILPNIIYHKDNIKWIQKNITKAYIAILIINALLTIVLLLGAPFIIVLLNGEKYLDAVPIFRTLVLGYFFSGSFRTLSVNLLAAFRRVYYGLFISVTSCVLDIVLNYLFIIRYGVIGAAYATLLVDIVTGFIALSYSAHLIKRGSINAIH